MFRLAVTADPIGFMNLVDGVYKPTAKGEKSNKTIPDGASYLIWVPKLLETSLAAAVCGRLESASPRSVVAALGLQEVSYLSASDASWGKTNRDDVDGGRDKKKTFRVSEREEVALKAKAATYGISVARLVVESALSKDGDSHTDRQAMIQELAQIRTLLGRVSSNVNQIARHANSTGEFPDDAAAAVAAMRLLMLRIDEAVRGVVGP